jgi:hypothetical protein
VRGTAAEEDARNGGGARGQEREKGGNGPVKKKATP